MKEKELPKGWSLRKLGACLKNHPEYGIGAAAVSYSPNLPTYLRITDIDEDGRFSPVNKASLTSENYRDYILNPGELVFARTGATVGKCYLYDPKDGQLVYAGFLIKVVPDESKLLPVFLKHFTESVQYTNWVKTNSTRSGQPGLNGKEYASMPILTPPIAEQKRITDFLDAWDEAIALQTRQLKQLRRRANALRLDLLLEKRRLDSFSKPWQEVKIGSLVKEVKRPVIWNDDEEYALISMRRRSGGAFLRERLLGHQILTKNLRTARSGDFLISKMQVVHGASGLVPTELDGMKVSGSYVALVSRNPSTFDINFLDCLSKLSWFYHLCFLCSYGVHIEKMTFDLADFLNQTIKVPTIDEQRAIAEVLNTAETEIRLNERKLEVLREQKRGLLQQLLTGEILLS